MRIALQAGHKNIQNNSIASLRGSTGAPGEASFNDDVCIQLSYKLASKGISVSLVDANANDDSEITGKDWDLFLAIHYDADIYSVGGGFVDVPDPSVDASNKESKRIATAIESEYFRTTGIINRHERSNANTKFYYIWQYLSSNTPCVLIECGVGQHRPDDYDIIYNHRDLVIEGLYKGICKAFNVPLEDEKSLEEQLTEVTALAQKEAEEVQRLKSDLDDSNIKLQAAEELARKRGADGQDLLKKLNNSDSSNTYLSNENSSLKSQLLACQKNSNSNSSNNADLKRINDLELENSSLRTTIKDLNSKTFLEVLLDKLLGGG